MTAQRADTPQQSPPWEAPELRVALATAAMTGAILFLHRAELAVTPFLVTAIAVGATVYAGVLWLSGRVMPGIRQSV